MTATARTQIDDPSAPGPQADLFGRAGLGSGPVAARRSASARPSAVGSPVRPSAVGGTGVRGDPYRAALRAARRLAHHPQERRLGRVVCRHLRELLAQES